MGRLMQRWHYKHNLSVERVIDLPDTVTDIDLIAMLNDLYGEGNWDYVFLKRGISYHKRMIKGSRVSLGM